MEGGGRFTPSSTTLHLDPTQARSVLSDELGLAIGDDAAIYLCIVLQHMIQRLVAGALASCDKPELRTKFGGTGKDVHPGTDMQPRHLQDYIRTDKDMWSLFNSSFAFQVVLAVFLDHATEKVLRRLGLPIHHKGALAACDYYATVINGLQQKRSSQVQARNNATSCTADSPQAPLSVTTSAQRARVAAGVNPLCSMSIKASLMASALVDEISIAVCEGAMRSEPDVRVITMIDLNGGIRDVFPEGLAAEATRAGKEAISAIWGEPEAPLRVSGEQADDQVRLCVRRLQGTHTLLKKTFRVSPGIFLFTVFGKACERLRIREITVVFIHDGMVLSGRRQAGTLVCEVAAMRRSVQIFAVCKRAWACKQRAAARRGLLTGSSTWPSDREESTRKQLHVAAPQNKREKPWQRLRRPPRFASKAKRVASGGLHTARSHPLLPALHPPGRTPPALPVRRETYEGGDGVVDGFETTSLRQTRRWIATPTEGTKLDLGRLERAPMPLPSKLAGRLKTGVPGGGSTGLLVDSDGALQTRDRLGGGGGVTEGEEVVLSSRIERTMRRLSAMEMCLRNLQDSMKELQMGDLEGRPSGISRVAMAAITSQLDVAHNLSSLCRQVLPRTDDGVRRSEDSVHAANGKQAENRPGFLETRASHSFEVGDDRRRLRDGNYREKGVSFLTEVPNNSRDTRGSIGFRSQAFAKESKSPAEIPSGSPLDAGADSTPTGEEGLCQQQVGNETSHRDKRETSVRRVEDMRALGRFGAGQWHNGARKQQSSSGSGRDRGRGAKTRDSAEGAIPNEEACSTRQKYDGRCNEPPLEAVPAALYRCGVERPLDESTATSAGHVPTSGRNVLREASAHAGGNGGNERHVRIPWDMGSRRDGASPRQVLGSNPEENLHRGRDISKTLTSQHCPPEQRGHHNGREAGSANDGGIAPTCRRATSVPVSEPSGSPSDATNIAPVARQKDTTLHNEPALLDRVEPAVPIESTVERGWGFAISELPAVDIDRRIFRSPPSADSGENTDHTGVGMSVATVKEFTEVVAGERRGVSREAAGRAEFIPLDTRRPSSTLPPQDDTHPEPEPRREPEPESEANPRSDEVWKERYEDIGVDDNDGNWSSWLRVGG